MDSHPKDLIQFMRSWHRVSQLSCCTFLSAHNPLGKFKIVQTGLFGIKSDQAKADSFAFAGEQSTPMDNNPILTDVMICQAMVHLDFLRKGQAQHLKKTISTPFSPHLL